MSTKTEIWKDIKIEKNGVIFDFSGKYQVSNLGNVRALNYKRSSKIQDLKPCKNTKGYLYVALWKDGKRKPFLLHRLVANAFIDNPNNLEQVNHKDEDKTNNNVSNLEYCTQQYNLAYGTGRERSAKTNRKVQGSRVIGHNPKTGRVLILISQSQGRKFGFAPSCINRCCRGEIKTHKEFKWRLLED